jgi:oxygen-dependent protoporphyrinogen oxidase
MRAMTIDVAIIGGGISGLATAYSLKNKGHRVVVLERQHHPGGNAVSERIDGFLMEHGPSTVNALSDTADRFSSELGLEATRCELGDGVTNRYLVKAGRLSGIPVHPLGFLTSGYLSLGAKLRMTAEIMIRRRCANSDETVGEFCTRRFGKEFAERVMDPMVGGIYSGRAAELSVGSVFPKLVAMEAEYGSVSLGVLLARRKGREMPGSRLDRLPSTRARRSAWSERRHGRNSATHFSDAWRLQGRCRRGWIIRCTGRCNRDPAACGREYA